MTSVGGNVYRFTFLAAWSTTNGQWRNTTTLAMYVPTHIAVTYTRDATTTDPLLYVNGLAVAITEITTPVGTAADDSAADLYFGNLDASGTRTFDGSIDGIRLWNVVRTAAQIRQFYKQRLNGAEANLAGYWPGRDGTGTTLANKVSGGNNGAITGASWRTRREGPR